MHDAFEDGEATKARGHEDSLPDLQQRELQCCLLSRQNWQLHTLQDHKAQLNTAVDMRAIMDESWLGCDHSPCYAIFSRSDRVLWGPTMIVSCSGDRSAVRARQVTAAVAVICCCQMF